jgi:hypothetical protein
VAYEKPLYLAHRLAVEGRVFYNNELTDPQWVERFFPKSPGSVTYQYEPKIAFPITRDILNNFASLLYRDAIVEIDKPYLQEDLDIFLETNQWHSLGRDIVVKTLYGGTLLAIIRPFGNSARIDTWGGEWTFIFDENTDYEMIGYCYKVKDGRREPLLREPENDRQAAKEGVTFVPITETLWGDFPHDFGFRPAVMFRAVDKQDDSPYPLPYHMRYREQNLEFNKLWSQLITALRILPNVWWTNKDREDPNNPLRISPFLINYLGQDGRLEQVARQVNLEPEFTALASLKNHIAVSAQVPDFMTGLEGVGKVESGVALSIVFSPLIQIVNRIKRDFRPSFIELLTKGFQADYILRTGRPAPEFALDVRFTDNVIPVDKDNEIDRIERADRMGVLLPEEKRRLVLPLLGLEVN